MTFMCIFIPTPTSDNTQQRKNIANATVKIKKCVRDLVTKSKWSTTGSFPYYNCTLL